MRHPDSLPKRALADIILRIREQMYWDADEDDWDRDKDVNGGDLVELVTDLLEEYSLVPEHSIRVDCSCPRCREEKASGGTPTPVTQ